MSADISINHCHDIHANSHILLRKIRLIPPPSDHLQNARKRYTRLAILQVNLDSIAPPSIYPLTSQTLPIYRLLPTPSTEPARHKRKKLLTCHRLPVTQFTSSARYRKNPRVGQKNQWFEHEHYVICNLSYPHQSALKQF
jgi:hypothetical protein